MATNQYHGVYSSSGATKLKTSRELSFDASSGTLKSVDPTPVERRDYKSLRRQGTNTYLSVDDLQKEKVNMAQIRLVSLTDPDPLYPAFLDKKSYIGFILTSMSESSAEKVEVVSLPGDSFTSYFFGRSPRTYSMQGIVLNTKEDAWRDSFELLYEEYLRGSRSATMGRVCQLKYDNRVITGWPLQLSMSVDSASDVYSTFSMAMLVTRVDILSYTLDTNILPYLRADGDYGSNLKKYSDSEVDSLVNIVRTGYTLPPPRPRSSGGVSSVATDCFLKAPNDDGSSSGTPAGGTVSEGLALATVCSAVETYRDTSIKIGELVKKSESKKGTPEADAYVAEARRLKEDLKLIESSPQFKQEINNAGAKTDGRYTVSTGRSKAVEVVVASGGVTVTRVDPGTKSGGVTSADVEARIDSAEKANTEKLKSERNRQAAKERDSLAARRPRVVTRP